MGKSDQVLGFVLLFMLPDFYSFSNVFQHPHGIFSSLSGEQGDAPQSDRLPRAASCARPSCVQRAIRDRSANAHGVLQGARSVVISAPSLFIAMHMFTWVGGSVDRTLQSSSSPCRALPLTRRSLNPNDC